MSVVSAQPPQSVRDVDVSVVANSVQPRRAAWKIVFVQFGERLSCENGEAKLRRRSVDDQMQRQLILILGNRI